MTRITRNTSISVGLIISLLVTVWFGASAFTTEKEKRKALERRVEKQEILMKDYMPRQELETNFEGINKQLDNIQETQKVILKSLD